MRRVHDARCRCADCRHARFNPGPPSSPRGFTFYGHFKRKWQAKQYRQRVLVETAHAAALKEHAERGFIGRLVAAVTGR